MKRKQLIKRIGECESLLSGIVADLMEEPHLHTFSHAELLDLSKDDKRSAQTPIWVEEKNGQVWVAVLDYMHEHVYAVYGIELKFDLEDYGKSWIAWSEDPSDCIAKSTEKSRSLRFSAIKEETAHE